MPHRTNTAGADTVKVYVESKPRKYTAYQYNGSILGFRLAIASVIDSTLVQAVIPGTPSAGTIRVVTEYGLQTLGIGDWLLVGEGGHVGPIDNRLFEQAFTITTE